jgi:hypothetical protein
MRDAPAGRPDEEKTMQTETLFRAARALEVIGTTIRKCAPALAFTFHGQGGELTVVLSGLPIGDSPEPNNLLGVADEINAYCDGFLGVDGFRLEFVQGTGVAAQFRVEAG